MVAGLSPLLPLLDPDSPSPLGWAPLFWLAAPPPSLLWPSWEPLLIDPDVRAACFAAVDESLEGADERGALPVGEEAAGAAG